MTTTTPQPTTEAAAPAPLTPAQAEILTADAIAHAEALATALHAIGETAAANNVRGEVKRACDRAVKAAANNARPKGPLVTVERYSHGDEVLSTSTVEVLRRTATQVVTLDEHDRVQRYHVVNGMDVSPYQRFAHSWLRVASRDLPAIAAMPIGANAVSRAYEATKAASELRR